MLLIWIAVVLLSLSWYPLTGIYQPTNIHFEPVIWFSIVCFAGAAIAVASSNAMPRFDISSRSLFVAFPALLLFLLLIPLPYSIGAIFLIGGVLLGVVSPARDKAGIVQIRSRILSSMILCGIVLLAQSAILPLFYLFGSRYHGTSLLSPLFSTALNTLGASTFASGNHLFLQGADRVFALIPSCEAFGLYHVVNILIASYCLLYFLSSPRKYYLLLSLVVGIYFVFRYLAVVLALVETERADILWRLDVLTMSLLPLPWIIAMMIRPATKAGSLTFALDGLFARKRALAFMVSLAIVFISVVGFFGLVDPGEKKKGRVLIDEKHSNWEWSTEEFNTTWYGEKSTYNYYSLADSLRHFYTVGHNFEPLTDDLLSDYDVVVIKTPTEPFAVDEVKSLLTFVERGGGLFLIGDHTNVFGITTNLNPIASQFGSRFRYDGQYDLNGELSVYRKPVILPHPVVQHMPPFLFATGCMLDAPLLAENAIIGYGIKSIYLDYARKNFFPKDAVNNECTEFGLFVQAAGILFGKGRVFLFTDSTVWSNFYMFMPGKPELLLGILDWLNRRNSPLQYGRIGLLVLAFVALGLSLMLSRHMTKRHLIAGVLITGLVIVPVGVVAFEQLNARFYPLPEPHTKYVKVNFESEHSHFDMPTLHVTMRIEESYHTFYVWVQRLGLIPSLRPSYLDALRDADVCVVVNPKKPFGQQEVTATREFLERGGKLLVMDDPGVTSFAATNELAANFGLQLVPMSIGSARFFKSVEDTTRVVGRSVGQVKGGQPALFAHAVVDQPVIGQSQLSHRPPAPLQHHHEAGVEPHGLAGLHEASRSMLFQSLPETRTIDTTQTWPVLAVQHVGKGLLAVLATSSVFTDMQMGTTARMPSPEMMKNYELEYWLFREVLKVQK